MTKQHDPSSFDLSRRTFVKGVGAAGLAGATAGTAAAEVNEEDVVSVGSGSFTTSIPNGFEYPSPPDPAYVTANVSAPYPTNDWWSGLLFGEYSSGPVIGLPYHASVGEAGLTVNYPTEWAGNPKKETTVVTDSKNTPGITIGHSLVDDFPDTRVNDWGDWHVQARWGTDTPKQVNVTMARGSPLLFAEYYGGDAKLTLTKDAEKKADESQVSIFEDRGNVLGVTVEADGTAKHFGLFAPKGATWSGKGKPTLFSGLGDGNYLTVAVLPEASSDLLDTFEQYAYNFIQGTTVDWEYVQSEDGTPVSEVRTTYSFETEAKPESSAEGTLTALFPHQWKYADEPFEDFSYWSPRGEMKVKTGPSFTTSHTYQGILPFEPTQGTQDMNQLKSYVSRLQSDFDRYTFGTPNSAYWVGKDFFRNSTVAPLAEQTGQTDAQEYFTQAVTDRLEAWFTAGDSDINSQPGQELFYYDDALGSLFEYPTDFGSVPAITDHHFHYGYFVYAAAEAARTNPEWAAEENWGGMVNRLVRDYANWERPERPSDLDAANDPKNAFPFLRNFDIYGGHSWAGGTVGNQKGNNQESSSEAVMAYAAMIRWGEITGNEDLRNTGIFLYTQESASVWEYWFDPADDSLPEDWGEKNTDFGTGGPDFEYASNVWGAGYWRKLWWAPSDPVEVFGINWLPIGGHSFYLAHDLTYAASNWSKTIQSRDRHMDLDDPTKELLAGWEPAAWGYRAMSDPTNAVEIMESELPVEPGGNSTPYIYNYVHFLNEVGYVDTDVVADVPFHQVFEDGEQRAYVVYNAGSESITATFSDGMELSVPAGEIVVEQSAEYYDADTSAPSKPANLSITSKNSYAVELEWGTSSDNSTVQYYTVYLDGSEHQTVPDTQIRIEDLGRGTDHTIEVSASDPFGNTSDRASVEFSTDSEDTASPKAPTSLQPSNLGQTSVDIAWSAAEDVGEGSGIDHYVVLVDGTEYTTVSGTSLTVEELDTGTQYTIAIQAVDGAGNKSDPSKVTITTIAEGQVQKPFKGRATIPGKIEAENFDQGGEGVAYHDADKINKANADYREGGVDIGAAGGGNYTLGYIPEGEWLEYSVTVEETGKYNVIVSVASAESGGPIHLEVDGENVTGAVDVPNTGSWTNYSKVTAAEGVQLEKGDHVVRLVADGGFWNIDWFAFEQPGGGAETTEEQTTEEQTTEEQTTEEQTTAVQTTDSPQQQSKTTPEPTTTTTSGPGFTVVSAVLGLFGLGAYLLRNDDEEEL